VERSHSKHQPLLSFYSAFHIKLLFHFCQIILYGYCSAVIVLFCLFEQKMLNSFIMWERCVRLLRISRKDRKFGVNGHFKVTLIFISLFDCHFTVSSETY